MRQQTYFRENLEMISDLFHTIGCHSVLYLWSVIFMKIRPSHYFYILRIVAIFAILLGVTVSATSFISFNLIYSGPTINAIIDIFPYIVFPIQSLLAVIFIVSGNPYIADQCCRYQFPPEKGNIKCLATDYSNADQVEFNGIH